MKIQQPTDNIKGDTIGGTIRRCFPYLILDKPWWAHITLFHSDIQQYNESVIQIVILL